MNAKSSLIATLIVASVAVPTIAAADSVYDWSFTGGGFTASGVVDVVGGNVQVAGTSGSITGGGVAGTQALTLITNAGPGVSAPDGSNPAPSSFTFTATGDYFEGDTVWNWNTPSLPNGPDVYGLVFQVGNSVNSSGAAQEALNIWVNPDGSAQASLSATATSADGRIYNVNNVGTFTVSAVPLPAGLPLLLSGLGGLGFFAARRRTAARS